MPQNLCTQKGNYWSGCSLAFRRLLIHLKSVSPDTHFDNYSIKLNRFTNIGQIIFNCKTVQLFGSIGQKQVELRPSHKRVLRQFVHVLDGLRNLSVNRLRKKEERDDRRDRQGSNYLRSARAISEQGFAQEQSPIYMGEGKA